MTLLNCSFQQDGLKVYTFEFKEFWAEFLLFLGPSIPPTPNSGIPRKRFHSTMITSPDGKGVIISGGYILTGSNGWKMKYLTTLIELRLNGTSNEFFWTVLDQRMKIPRERPVMFTVPDDYCIQQDFISHFLEHTSMIWIGLTIVGIVIILGLLSIASYMARRYRMLMNHFIILNYIFHIVGGTESVSSKF